jgi:molybdate transport system substrate-binding protein
MAHATRKSNSFRSTFATVALLSLALLLAGCRAAPRTTLTLSIAASLQNAMIEVESNYQRDHGGVEFRNNFGASGTLAREIEQGAPVDAILSAGTKPVDDLQAKGLLAPGTRMDLLRNTLVLIAPQDSRLAGFDELAGPVVRLVALGDPASVPAGQYGRQTLMSLQLYDKLNSKMVLGKDVRQVLTYVETGNADAGLVYGTDAQISKKVRVVAVAPESSHDPIVYPLAIVAGSLNPQAAREFLQYLSGAAARVVFEKHGFTMART